MQNTIKLSPFDEVGSTLEKNPTHQPLMIGCSGGGGHNAAIKGLHEYLTQKMPERMKESVHAPVVPGEHPSSPTTQQIQIGSRLMHLPIIGYVIRKILSFTPYPVLPDLQSLNSSIKELKLTNSNSRFYIDMLLDAYAAGYYSVAIWNCLQKNDEINELKKLISLQPMSDQENYATVKAYYLKVLKEAAEAEKPYTEIISTQAMALPALCDAVIAYNSSCPPLGPKLVIHQYLTDLPKGSIHFFGPLTALTKQQQEQMKLYGVGMTEKVILDFFKEEHSFAAICDIAPDKNPMVRPQFKEEEFDKSSQFHKDVEIDLNVVGKVDIKANQQIASIMLGSQAGNDSTRYIETMLESGIDKVFVFAGKNETVKSEITRIEQRYKGRIEALGPQDAKHMAQLLSRSNMVVTRGGGLSVMEQMAMEHNIEQTVLMHHADPVSQTDELQSGITWEDKNVECLIEYLMKKNVYATKTSPERAKRHILEARLIAAVKRVERDKGKLADTPYYIEKLDDSQLKHMVSALIKAEKEVEFSLPLLLTDHLSKCAEVSDKAVKALREKIHACHLVLAEFLHPKLENSCSQDKPENSCSQDKPENSCSQDKPENSCSQEWNNYAAIQRLKVILDAKNTTPYQKMLFFKQEYEKPETKSALMSRSHGFMTQIVKFIEYQLAKVFPAIAEGLDVHLQLRMHMHHLNKQNLEDENDAANAQCSRPQP
ncbi:MAG: hypothetical protein EBY16_01410 [Gammaproteobacteria bacterium]|nr:hypothetical protein [Gammaproteobacteria bacterium]